MLFITEPVYTELVKQKGVDGITTRRVKKSKKNDQNNILLLKVHEM